MTDALNVAAAVLLVTGAVVLYVELGKARTIRKALRMNLAVLMRQQATMEQLLAQHAEECVPVLRPCEIQPDTVAHGE